MPYDHATALRALLASTPDLIYFLDLDGRYRYVGQTGAALLGTTPEEMIGKNALELGIDPVLAAKARAQRDEVLRTGQAIRDESVFNAPSGEVALEYVIAPVVADGESLGVVVVTRDVSKRRAAEAALRESEEKFSTAFRSSPLALTITSLDDGKLVEINEGFTRMSGYTREEAVGKSPDELGLWVDPGRRAERFARLRDGDVVPEIEARFRVKNGEELIGAVGSAVVEINGRRCVLSSVTDVTTRVRAERAKDDFLATLSHELRTPLTSAFGWVKLLGKTREPETLEQGLRAIEDSLLTQIRLIDDLLDLSRIGAGKLSIDMQPVDFGGVIDSAVETVRHAAQGKRIDLRVNVRGVTTVCGDEGRLKQVIWNLLSNAVKFTPPGGTIDVELLERDGNAVVVVRDSGEGIEPQFLPHVFDRFRQADSSISRRHGGLGLGLSIVASLIDAHSGTVRAESEGLGKGATFTVTIPLIAQATAMHPMPPSSPAARPNDLAGARVIVVDDDAAARQLMITTLEAAGAEVRDFGNAAEAYEAMAIWRPHVLISDLAMPLEDGYSLIRRIRESGNDVPALAITAYVRFEDEVRVQEAGFQRHLAKPFDPDALVKTTAELVDRR